MKQMNHRCLCVASALLLGACQTVHELRQQPTGWEATYPVPFDTMANCLAAQWARDWSVVPQINQREQRAVVTVGLRSANIGEYDVRQSSPTGSSVTWRQAFQYKLDSRDVADRCARSA